MPTIEAVMTRPRVLAGAAGAAEVVSGAVLTADDLRPAIPSCGREGHIVRRRRAPRRRKHSGPTNATGPNTAVGRSAGPARRQQVGDGVLEMGA
ncbi:hypothetical protein GCM10009625_13460 [Brachybacterium fresconis]